MLDATTIDLGTTRSWTNTEAREARRLELEEQALELHAEILELVDQERQGRFGMIVRLGRMRDELLWKHLDLAPTFEDYAVKFGAATCHTLARQMADLAKQLESLPLLRRLLEAGKVHWTKIRDAAPAALEKPEDEAWWVEEVQKSSGDVVRRKAQEARGLTPTKRTTIDLPLEVDALWDHYRNVVGQRLGRPITKVESMRHLLASALRGEAWKDEQEPESPSTATGSSGTDSVAEPSTSKRTTGSQRVPNPPALLHLHECRRCRQVEIDGSVGPVTLSLATTATFRDDAFVQAAEGNVSRTIPAKVRRRVYARDRGMCVVPGCGARGFLETHHEGERGWKGTGHDEETMCLLCAAHHAARHEGWLRIEGTVSTGLRWFNASGKELFGAEVSTWWPEPKAPSSSKVEVANTACHTMVREESAPPGTTAHAADAVRDARLALRSMGLKQEADALIGVALSQLPTNATASDIAGAAFRAMH